MSVVRWVGPGLLVAATGVGAGDLAGAALAGNRLGCGVLWAVLVGAAIKYVQNEGIARYQLATTKTFLDATLRALPRPLGVLFLGYFVTWGFLVGAALMSACGVAAHAIAPLLDDPVHDKILYGALHGVAGYVLVRVGGFALFERVMRVAIAVMFVIVVWSAIRIAPQAEGVLRGLLVPTVPAADGAGLGWTLALLGGVGGTLTILCYGYWIREEGRTRKSDLPRMRVDLAVAYVMTAAFGVAMVVIGSTTEVSGRGATLIVGLASRLGEELGDVWRVAFLLGAYCAIASSLLGVWQSAPYLYADILAASRREPEDGAEARAGRRYRQCLAAIAVIPMLGLLVGFASMQKAYAVTGALFLPMLSLALLWRNRDPGLGELRDGPWTRAALVAILVVFGALLVQELG